MISLEIENLKQFTHDLFIGTVFDTCLVREASFTTACTYHIDGRTIFSDDTADTSKTDFVPWSYVKPACYTMIKGSRLPQQFSISLLLPKTLFPKVIFGIDTMITPEQIQSLVLNLRYLNKKVTCVTGTSLSVFTLDKAVEHAWDSYAKALLHPYI